MNNFPSPRYVCTLVWRAILLTAVTSFAACGKTPESLKKPNMTPLSLRLQPLFEKTKIVCFGRFVIEIPSTATLVFGPAEVGPEISYLPGEGEQIARHLAADLAEVQKSQKYLDKDDTARLPLFGKVIDGVVPGQKITFDSKDGVGYYINSYIPLGKDLFVLNVGSVMHEDYSMERLSKVVPYLRQRAEDEVPTEPGSCIEGGFVATALEYERIRIGVHLKEFPDVHLSVDVHKNRDSLEESASLEQTLKEGEEMAKAQGHGDAYARIKTFRRGARQLGPWKGTEMLARKPAYMDDTEAHEFYFHSLGALHDPLQPQLEVRLDSGVKNNQTARTKPSLTDDEAVALWDKLIGTIRARQTSDAKPGNSAPAKTPLGKLTATGDICTQQGWWQCTEGDNIEAGRRRHFTAGETMPHAILLGVPNLWQRLTGDTPRHTTMTIWELVAYDEDAAAAVAFISTATSATGVAPQTPAPENDSAPGEPPRHG